MRGGKAARRAAAERLARSQCFCGRLGRATATIRGLRRKRTATGQRSAAETQAHHAAKGQGENAISVHKFTPGLSARTCMAVGEL